METIATISAVASSALFFACAVQGAYHSTSNKAPTHRKTHEYALISGFLGLSAMYLAGAAGKLTLLEATGQIVATAALCMLALFFAWRGVEKLGFPLAAALFGASFAVAVTA